MSGKNHNDYELPELSKGDEHLHRIIEVKEGSIGEELEISAGDYLLAVNDEPIEDIFDYQFLIQDTELTITIRTAEGEEWDCEIEKEEEEDLGLVFANSLMDEYRSCHNKCIFCFIDQNPPGMRETIYFKDDDSRLSFLQGNYVTLTNMSDKDVDRIIRFHLAPINISVHTTNPELRCMMLHNRFAGEALEKMHKLYRAEIPMNGQIVLCKGINDGEELEHSLRDLLCLAPHMQSVSVVPAGLTKYREGLYPLEPFTKEDAIEVIKLVREIQDEAYAKHGIHFVQASDEWYLLAEEEVPEEDRYDGYIQLDNGVGKIRLFKEEMKRSLAEWKPEPHEKRKCTVITGKSFYGTMQEGMKALMEADPMMDVQTVMITNNFFGERITVTGLLTGGDIVEQLKGEDLGEYAILPSVSLKADEPIFLDDSSLDEVQDALQVPIHIVKSYGMNLIDAVTNPDYRNEHVLRYETGDD